MIIPYGHEHTTVRRLPWVTFSIMALCLVVFLATAVVSSDRSEEKALENLWAVFEYLSEHPYLELDSRFEQLVRERVSDEEMDQFNAFLEAIRQYGRERPDSQLAVDREQAELDRLVERFLDAIEEVKDSPLYRWGFVPADKGVVSVVTYQFLHGGWLHLIGNMLFLFLAGPFIEDVWGRPIFAAFYLVAGIVSALMFALHYPDLDGPLIGASGAVAGVMGAFLVRYWNTKIKFFYWFFIFFRGTFMAPAWLMLPLWFLRELLFAQAWDVIAPDSGGGGVAHWAHVWGFAFGLIVAGAIKQYQVEERYIHEAIESKITLHDNTAVEQAMEASSQGRPDEAVNRLRQELKARPHNVDAAVALWNLTLPRGQATDAAPYLLRVIGHSARSDDPTLVLNHWHELLAEVSDLKVAPPIAARVAEILHDHGRQDDLDATLALAERSLRADTAPGLLTRLARLAAVVHAPSAAALIAAALRHPELPPETRSELESLAAAQPPPALQEEAQLDLVPETDTPLDEAPRVQHGLQVKEVVPIDLADGTLTIEVQGSSRRLALDQVQAVGVGGVRRDGQRPFLVVDLLLDPPWSDRSELRAIRLLSTSFDPRKIVGGPDAMQAFRHLIGEILDLSDAVPLPDPDAARGDPFRTFPSIQAYQQQVLGVK